MDLPKLFFVFVVYFLSAHLQEASLGARLSGVYHRPIIVLVMVWVRQNGESSLMISVIRNQFVPVEPSVGELRSFGDLRSYGDRELLEGGREPAGRAQ